MDFINEKKKMYWREHQEAYKKYIKGETLNRENSLSLFEKFGSKSVDMFIFNSLYNNLTMNEEKNKRLKLTSSNNDLSNLIELNDKNNSELDHSKALKKNSTGSTNSLSNEIIDPHMKEKSKISAARAKATSTDTKSLKSNSSNSTNSDVEEINQDEQNNNNSGNKTPISSPPILKSKYRTIMPKPSQPSQSTTLIQPLKQIQTPSPKSSKKLAKSPHMSSPSSPSSTQTSSQISSHTKQSPSTRRKQSFSKSQKKSSNTTINSNTAPPTKKPGKKRGPKPKNKSNPTVSTITPSSSTSSIINLVSSSSTANLNKKGTHIYI